MVNEPCAPCEARQAALLEWVTGHWKLLAIALLGLLAIATFRPTPHRNLRRTHATD